MGDHIARAGKKHKIREFDEMARRRRATFKQYLRNIEEDLLEDDLDAPELDNPPEPEQDE